MGQGSGAEGHQIPVRAQWGEAQGIEPIFVDNMHLALINGQYYLTFGQLRFSISGSSIEGEIHPVARFVIPSDALGKISKVLQDTRDKVEPKDQ